MQFFKIRRSPSQTLACYRKVHRWSQLLSIELSATEFEASKYPEKLPFPPIEKLPNAPEYPLFSMLSKWRDANTIQYNLFYVGNVEGGYPIPRA